MKISVLMGIYNCEKTLAEAIESVLAQTERDFELILCDDGSTDGTYALAQEYARRDARIVLLRNSFNQGLNQTLNRCLAHAKGTYIARMDGDDRCVSCRFAVQLAFLEQHPEYAFVSSAMTMFDEQGAWGRTYPKPIPLARDFKRDTPFSHAPAMIRRAAIEAVQGYSVSDKLLRVEDFHLWAKLYAKGYYGYNLQEPLYLVREDREAATRRKFRYRINQARVQLYAIKELHLPIHYVLYCIPTLILGLLPKSLYCMLHRRKYKNREDGT
ncbi:MAG: glycosyltransferase [Clostridia bacterium]|nr:glycosyltransferase [Clostridia bacterium]